MDFFTRFCPLKNKALRRRREELFSKTCSSGAVLQDLFPRSFSSGVVFQELFFRGCSSGPFLQELFSRTCSPGVRGVGWFFPVKLSSQEKRGEGRKGATCRPKLLLRRYGIAKNCWTSCSTGVKFPSSNRFKSSFVVVFVCVGWADRGWRFLSVCFSQL